MMHAISSPSSSTTGFATLIFAIASQPRIHRSAIAGATIKAAVRRGKPTGRPFAPAGSREKPGY